MEFLATRLERLVKIQQLVLRDPVDSIVAGWLSALIARVKVGKRENLIRKIDLIELFFEHVSTPAGGVINGGCFDRPAFSLPIDHLRQDQVSAPRFPFLKKLTITFFERYTG